MSTSTSQNAFHFCGAIMFLSLSAFFIVGTIQIWNTTEAVNEYLESAALIDAQNQDKLENAQQFTSDMLAYVVALGLTEAGMLSATERNAIMTEAFDNISATSERWGTLAKGFNDAILAELEKQ